MAFAEGAGALDRFTEDGFGPLELASLEQGDAEVRRNLEPGGLVGRGQRVGTLEQVDRRRRVAAAKREQSGRSEAQAGAVGELQGLGIDGAELGAIGIGLLQVVAEELLGLDNAVAERPLEPYGVALVEIGTRRLGESLVGGLADEGVAEAERILTRQCRRLGADQLLAHQAHQPGGHRVPALRRRERDNPAEMEHLALDRRAFEQAALLGLELLEPRSQQALDCRRHGHLAATVRSGRASRAFARERADCPPRQRRCVPAPPARHRRRPAGLRSAMRTPRPRAGRARPRPR